MYRKNRLLLVHFLELLALSTLVPQIPAFIKSFDVSLLTVGLVGSVYGLAQLFSGPALGLWSDKYGRGKALVVCFSLCALGYVWLGLSMSLGAFIAARAFLGIFKHTTNMTKANLAECVPTEQYPKVFGQMTSFSSFAFMFGPIFGGYLVEVQGGYTGVCFVVSAMFAFNAVMLYFTDMSSASGRLSQGNSSKVRLLEELDKLDEIADTYESTNTKQFEFTGHSNRNDRSNSHPYANFDQDDQESGSSVKLPDCSDKACSHTVTYSLVSYASVLRSRVVSLIVTVKGVPWKLVRIPLLARLFLSLAFVMYRSNYILLFENDFGFTPTQVGYVISLCAAGGTVSGLSIPMYLRLLGSRQGQQKTETQWVPTDEKAAVRLYVIVNCMTVLCLVGIWCAANRWQLVLWSVLLSVAQNPARALGTSVVLARCVSSSTGKNDTGLVNGVFESSLAVARLLAPTVAGAVATGLGHHALVGVCAGVGLCGAGVASMLLWENSYLAGTQVNSSPRSSY